MPPAEIHRVEKYERRLHELHRLEAERPDLDPVPCIPDELAVEQQEQHEQQCDNIKCRDEPPDVQRRAPIKKKKKDHESAADQDPKHLQQKKME